MRVQVRYFASLADLTGTASETIEVEPEARVADLWSALAERHPALGDMAYRPMVACDMVYADWETDLTDVGEVAFLPPVSGG